MSRKSETPVGSTSDTFDEEKYQISTSMVQQAWQTISYTEGILLTQAEMLLGDDARLAAYKSSLKRELRRMGQYIQDNIYEGFEQQTPGINNPEPQVGSEETEGALRV